MTTSTAKRKRPKPKWADRQPVCTCCGKGLPKNRQCPRCLYGAALSYEEVAAIYNFRNPDDPEGPLTPNRVKVILQNIFGRLRSSVDREDSDVGRVLLGCLSDTGIARRRHV
jgi:hypothetical protein